MTNPQASILLGRDQSYLSTVRITSPKTYEFYMSFDKDKVKSCRLAKEEIDRVTIAMQEAYYALVEVKGITKFGIYLRDKGIIPHQNTFAAMVNDSFGREPIYRGYGRKVKIIKAYKEYKDGIL